MRAVCFSRVYDHFNANTYVAGEMQGGVPRCRWETTRMRPGARGYDCIGFAGLCSQHLSQRTPRTEHVEQSYGGSKLSGIGPEKALFTMIPPVLGIRFRNICFDAII